MHARPFSTFALTVLALVAASPAQQGTETKPRPKPVVQEPAKQGGAPATTDTPVPAPAQEPGDRELDAMRQQLVDGRVFRSHVRVTVRLKNGNRVSGVVKDGFVVERVDGMRFIESEANADGAGVRIYTYSGKRNYVFLSFSEMQEYRINQRMTTAELQSYERRMRESEDAQRRQQDEQAAEVQPAPSTEGATTPADGTQPTDKPKGEPAAEKKPASVTDELQAMFALLQEYPPAEGWNAQKRDEISRRKAVIGANPSAKEQKFVEKFGDWQRACAILGAKAPGAESQPAAEEPTSGSRRKKNR